MDDRNGRSQPGSAHVAEIEHVGQFGEFDGTGAGTDLTLEWDSTDPDLHAHLTTITPPGDSVKPKPEEDGNNGWNVDEMGIPDA